MATNIPFLFVYYNKVSFLLCNDKIVYLNNINIETVIFIFLRFSHNFTVIRK